MKKLLCPSMMCADFGSLEKEIKSLESAGADIFHLDVMDGHFVPNFALGMEDVSYICSHADIPCDVHLMIENPGNYVENFINLGAKIIYVHPESEYHCMRTLQKISDLGAIPAIAINPGTSVSSVVPLLSSIKYLLVMSVNPGFAGQKYIESTTEKIKKLIEIKDDYDFEIMMDGACSPSRIKDFSSLGVTGFVLGTSALFGKGKSYAEIIPELREEHD